MVPIITRAPHGVIFVERARHLRRHPGQIGFPGGTAEPLDGGDPVKTALRELFEELAVGAEHVSVVGRLPDLTQESNGFVITPVVGLVDATARLSVDGDEIVGVFAVPLELIVADGAIYEDATLGEVRGRKMYVFNYEGRRIWGFTARILKSFAEEWSAPASALRSAIEAALQGDT